MAKITRGYVFRLVALLIAIGFASQNPGVLAQDSQRRFDQPALDAMLAPIALYPDQLLSQVLMAATYPDEVEEAARWLRARPGLSADAAVRSAEGWDWDPSVRSLTAFPHVLATMHQYMGWTRELGSAFIDQPQDVMDAVQRLRFRAFEAGTLTSTEHTRVIHTGSSLIIESVRPQVVHIPHYDPRVAYGSWWSPVRAPVYWNRWPGYYDPPGRSVIVHWGPSVWLAPGFFYGGFDWPRREVRIVNVHTYYYVPRTVVVTRPAEIHRHTHVHREPPIVTPHVWRHDTSRRIESPRHGQHTERHLHAPPSRAVQPGRDSTQQLPARAPYEVHAPRHHDRDRHEQQTHHRRRTDDDPRAAGMRQPNRTAPSVTSSANAPSQQPAPLVQSPGRAASGAPQRNEMRADSPREEGDGRRRKARPRDGD